jgi:hypothetical protein
LDERQKIDHAQAYKKLLVLLAMREDLTRNSPRLDEEITSIEDLLRSFLVIAPDETYIGARHDLAEMKDALNQTPGPHTAGTE